MLGPTCLGVEKYLDDDLRDERTVKGAVLQTLLKYSHSPYWANIATSLVSSLKINPGEIKNFYVQMGEVI